MLSKPHNTRCSRQRNRVTVAPQMSFVVRR
jgi:hypothetical protein